VQAEEELFSMDILTEINRVIELEGQTVSRLRESVGPACEEAVREIFKSPGKVILTGIGKSGLIAQKIASTMVSTGTSAIFLHPAEGMHGDIGIVRSDDVLIALSKSGESDELIGLLPAIRRIGARLIVVTAKADSTLGRSSDILLLTPVEEEACPLNMAPTCSTTAALVLGDALAMALMKLRNFQPEDFALSHPGGQLGKRLLLTVGDIMRSGEANPIIDVMSRLQDMLCVITSKRAGAVSVVDHDGHLMGLVTDYDIRHVLEKGGDIFSMTISDIMNKKPTFVYSDEKALHALELMENRDKPFLVLPVLDRLNKTVGMIHLHDIVARGL
jgi:arabinose-5-phosphate isomerase